MFDVSLGVADTNGGQGYRPSNPCRLHKKASEMKIKQSVAVLALGVLASGAATAQNDPNSRPLSEFRQCDDREFECEDRTNPVTRDPETTLHRISLSSNKRMIYKVGLKPQPQRYVLVAEYYRTITRQVDEPAKPAVVLVEPIATPPTITTPPWAYVSPK